MELPHFTNLKKNKGDKPTETTVYRIEADSKNYSYGFLMGQTPEDTACALSNGYIWCCWVDQNKDIEDLKQAVSNKEGIGSISKKSINLTSDDWWEKIGFSLLRSSFICKAYQSGPYFKDDDKRLCYGQKLEEEEGRRLFGSIETHFYRNKDKKNFFVAIDTSSSVQIEENPPNPWKDTEYLLDIKPSSEDRLNRVSNIISDLKSEDGSISIKINDTKLKFDDYYNFNQEVERK